MILSQYAKKPEVGADEHLPVHLRQCWSDAVLPVHVRVDRILKDGITTGIVSDYPKGFICLCISMVLMRQII